MNKLVSKNPVLRFKLGKKIVKALFGLKWDWKDTIKRKGDGTFTFNSPVKNLLYNSEFFRNNPLIIKRILKPIKNIVTPIDNYYVKGFGGDRLKDEITKAGGVRAMLKKLIEMGLLKDKYGADGRWGLNTQEAYNKYKQMLAPGLPTAEEAGPVEKIPVELRTPVMENVPLGYGASLALAANKFIHLKLGGLISRNPILKFKRNFRYVAQ